MQLLPRNLKIPKFDNWGHPYIWIPFGIQGVVNGVSGDYMVYEDDILNERSISTLSGVQAYIFHPESPVSFGNPLTSQPVGICTDKYRIIPGGAEVLVRITDPKAYADIASGYIKEVSPAYSVVSDEDCGDGTLSPCPPYRVYNHMALLPEGYARGGSKMKIMMEGVDAAEEVKPVSPFKEIYQFSLNDFEIESIMKTDDTIKTPSDVVETTPSVVVEPTPVVSEGLAPKVSTVEVSTISTELLIEFRAAIATLKELAKPVITPPTTPEVVLEGNSITQEAIDALVLEGFEKGKLAGEILSTASTHGYEGTDVTESQRFVATKAFPTLVLEGMSADALSGVYTAALAALAVVVPTPTMSAIAVPTVDSETVSTPLKRYNIT